MLSQSDDTDTKALMLEKALTAIKSAVKRSADSDDEVMDGWINDESDKRRFHALFFIFIIGLKTKDM